ncbi:MAG: SMP-30/gluconolactonase/LRE family protein [Acidobacteriota bacterium]|nr:SMP-30/gluconolactonase/LRE family protein [Acidobacteriota bacterium]
MTPELIADYQCVCGEGPMWHPLEKRVYWVDIPQGKLFRYDPATCEHEQCYQDVAIGGFTVQADGALLLFMDKGMVKVWREGSVETILDGLPGEEDSRFNDVIADPEGRVFCGTMASPNHLGRLYRMDVDGSITQILDGIGCSNGMGFTPDRKQMYYTDSPLREISVFDYDQASGEITNRRVFAKTEGDGGPDGMTVDAEGCVWSARWDGGCLVRYSPDGQEMQRVSFPAKKVSSVIFGGEDYKDIYVTTAGGDNKPAEGEGAGALFRVNLGIKGVPEFLSKVRV